MKKLVIFSGTTEGRTLSGMLAESGIRHTICVATDYGGELMGRDPCTEIRIGRMDREQMTGFLRERAFSADDLVVDATHPYAREATENIRAAAEHAGTGYLRVLRAQEETDDAEIIRYDDMVSCAKALARTEGRILLTTGSKELGSYCASAPEEMRERTYVRVLPSRESLEICLQAGFAAKNIIAMQGPFTASMNRAILEQYAIRHLVTKESGAAGGFPEKLEAAREAGVQCHVISRPVQEEGVDVGEAYRRIAGREYAGSGVRRIVLAGYGPGAPETVTDEVKTALERADAVFGAARLTDPLCVRRKYAMYRAEEIIRVLEEDPGIRSAVILFSGDSGSYSGARSMVAALRTWDEKAEIRILPGISAVSCLAARLAESYDDAQIISIHGRKNGKTMNRLLTMVRYHRKTYVLLSGEEDVRDIGEMLNTAGIDGTVFIGADLTGPGERIIKLKPAEAAGYHGQGSLTALIVNEAAEKRPIVPVRRDEAFIRERVPMTKESIRHESILRLDLREGDVVYDIGGGTGSVALEIASLDPSLTVYTFERDPDACRLIEENAKHLMVSNVTVICGEAPEALSGVETPDRVFIGGSGGHLREILDALKTGDRKIRCVINAVTMETIEEVGRLIRESDASDAEIVQLACSQVKEIGGYHMMQAQNPVMIYAFTI